MAIVEINGWSPGFQKVSCTKTLQSVAGLGLAEAKRITDAVLDGQLQRVQLQSVADAQQLSAALQRLGVSAHVVAAA